MLLREQYSSANDFVALGLCRSAAFASQLMMMAQSSVNSLVATIFIVFASINGCTSMPHAPYASTMYGKTLAAVAAKKYKSLYENMENSYPTVLASRW